MAQPVQKPVEDRRRANRTAISLAASVRDSTRSKTRARVIDMSVGGCRIESPFAVKEGGWVWLSILGLETQYCRVVWQCEEFVGLEFETPLSEPVFERLLEGRRPLADTAIKDLLNIATRAHWLARQTNETNIPILAELSRKCAEDAVVQGLKRSEAGPPDGE